ncbi:hypothetical protein PMIN01_11848 [Paraphaeosphaeria minitans]|uniref:Uncharacterized protein n=1 Tax=Paraphaeosphaeria minitans TaxID=565426 RepID=A0A9P6G7L3_9PLEO|nr:hypothetical protein PMIN01_11829 [Paraphaeosphaeria minitans]KAF9729915.1 hypothetical protein PMIN01_11848 [Paraphaeosphaeria minitans]
MRLRHLRLEIRGLSISRVAVHR